MRQRAYDKQNNSTIQYEVRTRQCTQFDQQFEYASREKQPKRQYSYYEPTKIEDQANNLEDSIHYDKKPISRNTYDYAFSKPNKP